MNGTLEKKIYTIIPFYEFSRYFFKLVFFLKLLSYSEKIILCIMCIKLKFKFSLEENIETNLIYL